MKRSVILEELYLWLKGRFSMTNEEKVWLLLLFIIIWVGLIGRYAYLKNQSSETLSPQQVEELLQTNQQSKPANP